ncbi:MAG: stealth conserved region 3 domain-containing protein [Nocardioides sp.]
MKIAFMVFNLDGMGGTSRSAVTQANALVADHDVRFISITRSADRPHYDLDQRVRVDYLVDVRDDDAPLAVADGLVEPAHAKRLHARESALVPERWDRQFTALCDLAIEAELPVLDVDVAVSVTPGLLACAVQLLPDQVVVVHQEHRSSSGRTSGSEPLLVFAPQADVVALLTPSIEEWLVAELGDLAPHTVVMPNPLPIGFAPRSRLDTPLIVAAGRLVQEKQYPKLLAAFAEIADRIPGWRLRIYGEGPGRLDLLRQIRKTGLWDRVELPGKVDMTGEWAKASVSALTSRSEGFPLVMQEAMAAGVPVASFDCASGPREIIEHEVNGLLVSPESTSGLAAALLRLCTDDDLRRRLGEGALRSSRQYDAHALAERWVGIFADARARRAGRGRLAARAQRKVVSRLVAGAPRTSTTETFLGEGVTPAQARHEALSWAVKAARSATRDWFVIPAHGEPAPVLVVPMRDRDAFLETLGGADAPAYLSLREPADHGWHERRGTLREMTAGLRRGRTPVIHLEPWPTEGERTTMLAHGCTVDVEFWETSATGDLLGARRNRYADRVPTDAETVEVDVEGVPVRTLPLMAAPTATECRFPVDVVYTWVDGQDPGWNAAREQRLAAITGTALHTARSRESSGRARFIARDELRYSFRSVHLFAPWVRRIHLVTAGQTPDWLDISHPMINLVDHRDILPTDGLPTFNSHAIETSLHRIEGLSEHFLYLNDDFFLGRPVRTESFFTPSGSFATFFSHVPIGLSDQPDAPPFLKAAWNNRHLLHDAFGAVTTNNLAHAPYPHRVSVIEELTARFPEVLAGTARSPFRNDTDVSTLSSLAQHYGLLTGSAYVGDADLFYVNLTSSDVDRQLAMAVKRREWDFICLGDQHDHAVANHRLDEFLADFYTAYFPVAAPWERD